MGGESGPAASLDAATMSALSAALGGGTVDITFSEVVRKINKYGKLQKRTIVLANTMMVTLKVKGKAASVQRQDFLYNLLDVKVSDTEVVVQFPDFVLRMQAEPASAMAIVQGIYAEYSRLTNGCRDPSVARFTGKYMTQSMTTSFLSAGIVPMTDEAGFTYRFNAACRLFGAQPNADLRARLMAVVCQAREGPDADTLTITNTLYPDLDTQTALALFKALSYGMRFTKIRIHDIQLKDTGMNAALQAISRHPGVTVLEMRKTGATVASVPLLRSVLLRDPPLQSYDISCNDLEEAGMILVADVVACTKRPQESLTVARLKSQALGTGRLLQSIQHNVVLVGSLRSLDLSGNTIGPAAADSLSSLFAMDAWRLERLFVNNCQISDEGVAGCLVAAARCPTLKELSVSKNAFGDVIAVQLCAGIAANPTLEVLNVSFLKVSARAIEALVASAFRSERQRMEMDISGNDLGDYVGVKIASILSESRIVHSLAADHCELGHAAISWILKGLTGGPIARLSLSSNVLDNEGDDDDEALANALRDFVRSTPLLSELLLADNSTTKAHMRLDPMLSELKTGAPALTALDIQGNAMGDEGMMALADAIKANHTLTSLQLDQNNTKVAGLQCLADAIEANDTLVRMPFPTRDYKFALQAATNHELVKQIPARIDRKLADNMARLQHT